MVTFEVLTIELQFSDVLPETVLEHLASFREYSDDAFVYAGNLVVRLCNHVEYDDVKEAIIEICRRYDGVNRALLQTSNDTVMADWKTLYHWCENTPGLAESFETQETTPHAWATTVSEDGFRGIESFETGQGYDRVSLVNLHVISIDTFAGVPVPNQHPLDCDKEPIEYLMLEYGFYSLSCYETVYPDDWMIRCPEPPNEE